MTHKFTDRASIGELRDTAEGYLVTLARVARTGIQVYDRAELGMLGAGTVRVNRDASEVFNKDAFKTLVHAPITIDHPREVVTADNWKELAVGEVGENVLRDGEMIAVSLMLKDADGIKKARTTHKEISLGYEALLVDAPPGADYDFDMKNFRYNHLALVPRGRAGYAARIGDADNWGASPVTTKDIQMDMKTVVIGDASLTVAASDADKLTKMIADHTRALADAAKATATAEAARDVALSKVLSDADLDALVADRAAHAVKLQAVMDAKGAEFVKDKSKDYIAAAYDLLDAAPATSPLRTALADKKPMKKPGSAWDKFIPGNKKDDM